MIRTHFQDYVLYLLGGGAGIFASVQLLYRTPRSRDPGTQTGILCVGLETESAFARSDEGADTVKPH